MIVFFFSVKQLDFYENTTNIIIISACRADLVETSLLFFELLTEILRKKYGKTLKLTKNPNFVFSFKIYVYRFSLRSEPLFSKAIGSSLASKLSSKREILKTLSNCVSYLRLDNFLVIHSQHWAYSYIIPETSIEKKASVALRAERFTRPAVIQFESGDKFLTNKNFRR